MFGIAAATIVLGIVAPRVPWRVLGLVACIVLALANFASTFAHGLTVMSCVRFLAGLGAGVLITWGYAAIGLTRRSGRNFGLLITAVLTYSALALLSLPTAYLTIGFDGVLIGLAVLALLALTCLAKLPDRLSDRHAYPDHTFRKVPSRQRTLALGSILAFFLAQGVVWAYLFLIGLAVGVDEQSVATGLTISQLAGIAGALTAALAGERVSHTSLLTVSVAIGIAPLFWLMYPMTAVAYAISVCAFNYSANVLTPLLMAMIARFDHSGQLVTRAIAAQMIGLAVGPALAARVIQANDYTRSLTMCVVLLAISLALMLAALRAQRPATLGITD
jgi:predicted MFS family arabinose efflux permease